MTRQSFLLALIAPFTKLISARQIPAWAIPSRFRCSWCGTPLRCHDSLEEMDSGQPGKLSFLSTNPETSWEWCPSPKCGWWDAMPTRQEAEADRDWQRQEKRRTCQV